MINVFKKIFSKPEINQPVWVLYTRTYRNDYTFMNKFQDNVKKIDLMRNIGGMISELYGIRNEKSFANRNFGNSSILLWKVIDGRQDNVGRKICSYFGVVVDARSKFDIKQLILQVENQVQIMKENQMDCFDLACNFPLVWDTSKELPTKIKNTDYEFNK